MSTTNVSSTNGNILVKGTNLTKEQRQLLKFNGMKSEKWVKNHSFWFKNGLPSIEEGYYYPVSHSFSHLQN